MSRTLILGLAAAALIAPALAQAQEAETARMIAEKVAQAGGGRGGRVVAGAVETKTTVGRPYSAEAVTEMTQVLGDGNRIQNRASNRVYRDGEGRTRREVLDDDGTVVSISISDPVAHANYTLDPKAKVAFKAGGNIVYPLRTPAAGGVMVSNGVAGQATASATIAERQAVERQAAAAAGGGAATRMRTPAPDDPNVTTEELGVQNIEGVSATGTRTTTVIPTGKIGNAQEIRIVSERWFSDELQVLVMTRHSDPRNGETVYRLRSILRAEPDQNLFTVPPDYTIQQRGVRRPE
jgi:hypothetical protein